MTAEKFTDFDLQWDWRIPPKANNGVKYLVDENRPQAPGHEYQMIDDAIVAKIPKQSTAAFYDVIAPKPDKPLHPPGEWNHSRVLVQGNHVEHWLNGEKIVEYDRNTPEFHKLVAGSKYHAIEGFGDWPDGHILLQEHGSMVSFRNVKIRVLPTK